jgi:uncharacterized membrane protein
MNPVLLAGATVLFLDFIWLNLNKDYHKNLFKSVQGSPLHIRIFPALLVYILIPLAVVFFAVNKASSLKDAGLRGALLGLAMYGLYDLTNLSTLSGWTYEMVLRDVSWGTLVCGAAAYVSYKFKD